MAAPKWIFVIVFGLIFSACAQDVANEARIPNSFYFPIDVAADPSNQRFVYVLNSNLDYRYDTGWVSVIDLEDALAPDASPIAGLRDGVDVPSLGTSLVQRDADGVLLVTGRGTRTVSVVRPRVNDAQDDITFRCVGSDAPCNHASNFHVSASDVGNGASNQNLASPSNAVFFDLERNSVLKHYAAIAYLGSNFFSVFEIPSSGAITHVRSGLLGAIAVGSLGLHPSVCNNTRAYVVAGSQPLTSTGNGQLLHIDMNRFLDTQDDAIFAVDLQQSVGSRSVIATVFHPAVDACDTTGHVLYTAAAGFGDSANITALDATLANTMVNDVSTLEPFDTHVIQRPKYDIADVLPVGGRLGKALYLQRSGGDILAVSAFDDNAIYFIAVNGSSMQLITRYENNIGRGPFGLAEATYNGKQYLIVPSFFDHSVSIIQVDGRDPARFQTVKRVFNPASPTSGRAS